MQPFIIYYRHPDVGSGFSGLAVFPHINMWKTAKPYPGGFFSVEKLNIKNGKQSTVNIRFGSLSGGFAKLIN